ncbi:hypothetical protein ACHAXR_001528, partial [Thalassiosira sp. AJA248-18]
MGVGATCFTISFSAGCTTHNLPSQPSGLMQQECTIWEQRRLAPLELFLMLRTCGKNRSQRINNFLVSLVHDPSTKRICTATTWAHYLERDS